MNNKLGLSLLLLFLFFTLPYLNCFNENKICNIFNPCNECMKEYNEKLLERAPFPFEDSLEYSSGKISGAYERIFAISSDGEIIFSLKLNRTERTGFYFIFPPILHSSKYYAVSECGEVLVINEKSSNHIV